MAFANFTRKRRPSSTSIAKEFDVAGLLTSCACWNMVQDTERRSPNEQTDAVLSYSKAAAFLGVSERSLQRYVTEGLIPYVRLPKRGAWAGVRFVRSELLRWLERRTVKPRSVNTPRGGREGV